MLKKRIIAVLPIYNGIVVQSFGFNRYLPVGRPEIAIEFLNQWDIDEIIALDITSRKNKKPVTDKFVEKISTKCFVPLTVGGGIRNIYDVDKIIHSGADKISLNNPILYKPEFIKEITKNYGVQCVVASIDIIKSENDYGVYDYLNKKIFEKSIQDVINRAIDAGVGEILLNCVHRDGMYNGYEIDLFRNLQKISTVPLLACGGASNPYDIIKLLKETNVSAACVGNYFHFYEHSVTITKRVIKKQFEDIRMDSLSNYSKNNFHESGRLAKKDEKELEDLLYVRIEKEII